MECSHEFEIFETINTALKICPRLENRLPQVVALDEISSTMNTWKNPGKCCANLVLVAFFSRLLLLSSSSKTKKKE